MLGKNRGILAKIYLIFCKKIASYINVFYLVNADLACRKVFALVDLVLQQL